MPKNRLSYVIVEDIALTGAFDKAVISDPPFDAVLHTASPFHFNIVDPQKDLIDPAVMGTTGILKALKEKAPSVRRVAITSSFAAIVNPKGHPKKYDESIWNPVTLEEALGDKFTAYRGSKTLAEKAAWDFMENEKPSFQLSTLCPPFVFGPVVHYLNSLESLNTSNARVRDIMQGRMKEKLIPTGTFIFVDVRDLALAHVRAVEVPEAAGQRFLITAGYMTNKDIVEIIRRNFPDMASNLPSKPQSDMPEDIYEYDNTRSLRILGLKYRSLEECVMDTVKSLQAVGV